MGATLAAHCCASEEEDQPAMKGLKKDWMIGHDEARACTVIIMQLLKNGNHTKSSCFNSTRTCG